MTFDELLKLIVPNIGKDDKVIELYNELEKMELSEEEKTIAENSFEINLLYSAYGDVMYYKDKNKNEV